MPKKVLKCMCCGTQIEVNLTVGESALLTSETIGKMFPFFLKGLSVCERCTEVLPKSETLVVMPFPMKDKFISREEMLKMVGGKRK